MAKLTPLFQLRSPQALGCSECWVECPVITLHEGLIGQKARQRCDDRDDELTLAQIGSLLFIAGTRESLAPFVNIHATLLVNDSEDPM